MNTRAQFTFLKELGVGASCKVHAVQSKESGNKYAMKVLDKEDQYNKTLWESECRILRTLKHENILEFVDAWQDSKTYHILTVLCEGGELFDKITATGGGFTDKMASELTRMMVYSVLYCHEHQIVHRDLKPENFVFATRSPDSPMKLIDFGCALEVEDNQVIASVAGSPYYVAPEVLVTQMKRTGATWKSSDMWSVGVIVYLFVCGFPPFNGASQKDIFRKIKRGIYHFPSSSEADLSDGVKDLIQKLLVLDPRKRMTAKEAINHPWVKGETASDKVISSTVVNALEGFRNHCRLKKAVGRVLGNNMTEEDKNQLSSVFKKFDKNGDGKLGPAEIGELMKHIGKGENEAKDMLAHLDEDGDGELDIEEFATVHGMTKLAESEQEMKKAFDMFDIDGDGFVSNDEIEKLCEFLSPEMARQLIEEADSSGDGRIDFVEWIEAMNKGKKQINEGARTSEGGTEP